MQKKLLTGRQLGCLFSAEFYFLDLAEDTEITGQICFGGGPPWRQKWMNMSDEERAKFREEWKKRCQHNQKRE